MQTLKYEREEKEQ